MLEKLPVGLGEALQGQRAGLERTIIHRIANKDRLMRLEVRSSAFDQHRPLPVKYTADGVGLSPPLEWMGVPDSASTLAIVVEDADSPTPHPLVHAIIVRHDLHATALREGALNSPDHAGDEPQTGRNSFLSQAWLPPDPPPGHGIHRYVFQVFALGAVQFSAAPGRQEVHAAIEQHGLAAGCCLGTYGRGEAVFEPAPSTEAGIPQTA